MHEQLNETNVLNLQGFDSFTLHGVNGAGAWMSQGACFRIAKTMKS